MSAILKTTFFRNKSYVAELKRALGIYIHRRISGSLFIKIIYGMVLIVGVQLLIGKSGF